MVLAAFDIGDSVEHAFNVFFDWLPNLLAALAVLIIGYMSGYNVRKVEERREAEAQVARDLDRTIDPLVQTPVNPGLVQNPPPTRTAQQSPPAVSRPSGASGAGSVPAPAGGSRASGVILVERAADDPRQ